MFNGTKVATYIVSYNFFFPFHAIHTLVSFMLLRVHILTSFVVLYILSSFTVVISHDGFSSISENPICFVQQTIMYFVNAIPLRTCEKA